jgi:hypothetical protein
MAIKSKGFLEKSLECPALKGEFEKIREYTEKNRFLPSPCSECCTIILYSAKDERNILNFNKFLHEEFGIKNCVNYEMIYLRCREENREEWIKEFEEKLRRYEIEGRIEWRRCCKRLQREFPYLFENAKTFSRLYQVRLDQFF